MGPESETGEKSIEEELAENRQAVLALRKKLEERRASKTTGSNAEGSADAHPVSAAPPIPARAIPPVFRSIEEPDPSEGGTPFSGEHTVDEGITFTDADLDETGVRHAAGTPPPDPDGQSHDTSDRILTSVALPPIGGSAPASGDTDKPLTSVALPPAGGSVDPTGVALPPADGWTEPVVSTPPPLPPQTPPPGEPPPLPPLPPPEEKADDTERDDNSIASEEYIKPGGVWEEKKGQGLEAFFERDNSGYQILGPIDNVHFPILAANVRESTAGGVALSQDELANVVYARSVREFYDAIGDEAKLDLDYLESGFRKKVTREGQTATIEVNGSKYKIVGHSGESNHPISLEDPSGKKIAARLSAKDLSAISYEPLSSDSAGASDARPGRESTDPVLSQKIEWEWEETDETMRKIGDLIFEANKIRRVFEAGNLPAPDSAAEIHERLTAVNDIAGQLRELRGNLATKQEKDENVANYIASIDQCQNMLDHCRGLVFQRMQDYRMETGCQYVYDEASNSTVEKDMHIFVLQPNGPFGFRTGMSEGTNLARNLYSPKFRIVSPKDFEEEFKNSVNPLKTFERNGLWKHGNDEFNTIVRTADNAEEKGFEIIVSKDGREYKLDIDKDNDELRLVDKDETTIVTDPIQLAQQYDWKLRPVITKPAEQATEPATDDNGEMAALLRMRAQIKESKGQTGKAAEAKAMADALDDGQVAAPASTDIAEMQALVDAKVARDAARANQDTESK